MLLNRLINPSNIYFARPILRYYAEQGFLYLRAEYLFLYEKLLAILAERRNSNLLGHNILQQGLNFDIEIRLGAGAYICGEESALGTRMK